MQFTSELPISVLNQIQLPYAFVIKPYLKNSRYEAWVTKMKATNKYGIMDNGAFEKANGGKNIIVSTCHDRQFYNAIPDGKHLTMEQQKQKIATHYKGKTMFVPHANNPWDYLELCAYYCARITTHNKHHPMQKPARGLIGLAYQQTFYSKNRWLAAFKRYRIASGLNKLLNKVNPENTINIHLLGTRSIFELWLCRNLNRVKSADSSLPVLHALAGIKTGLFTRKIKQPKDFILNPIVVDIDTIDLIQRNIDYVCKKVGK